MRYTPIDPQQLFVENRASSETVVAAHPRRRQRQRRPAHQRRRLFPAQAKHRPVYPHRHRTGGAFCCCIDAHDEKHREILFCASQIRFRTRGSQTHQSRGKKISGIARVEWSPDFPALFHRLMCECEHAYLNLTSTNAHIVVETREARFQERRCRRSIRCTAINARKVVARVTRHQIQNRSCLDPKACDITGRLAFGASAKVVKPGVNEMEWRLSLPVNSSGAAGNSPTIRSSPAALTPARCIIFRTISLVGTDNCSCSMSRPVTRITTPISRARFR